MLDTTTSFATLPVRKPFSEAQLAEATQLGYVTDEHRRARRHIVAHAIDNVTPDILADRDDALYVTPLPDGGSLLEITIADVAAHVGLKTLLAPVAHERGFTEYRPQSNDPMYPHLLEGRMSLEHQQERLALTTRCWLNAQHQPVHTEFERTIAVCDNVNYAMAAERGRSDPQFMQMRQVLGGLRRQMQWRMPSAFDEAEMDGRAQLPQKYLSWRKHVETGMVTDNTLKATFAHEAELPFIFRNFDDDAVDDQGIARAYYSARWKGHDAMARDGLITAYGHCTSPIRRGADYYSGIITHYVIDCLEDLEAAASEGLSAQQQAQWHHALWAHKSQLFRWQSQSGPHPAEQRVEAMAAQLQRHLPRGHRSVAALQDAAFVFLAAHPPLTRSQLDRYMLPMNALVAVEQRALQAPELQRWRHELAISKRQDERVETIEDLSADVLQAKSSDEFSRSLNTAARYAALSQAMEAEALRRIDTVRHGRKLTQDAFSILIVAPPTAEWIPLKKAICSTIKNSPDVVNGVLDLALHHGYIKKELFSPPEAVQSSRNNTVMAALAKYGDDINHAVAPPFYSVGHDARSAETHATYSFLEHWAFGQLRPIEQSKIPNLLYALLDQPDANRHELIEQMATEIGARFSLVHYTRDGVEHTKAIIKGGSLIAPIIAEGNASESPQTDRLAMRRLLRDEAFKDALNFTDLDRMEEMLRPAIRLREKLTKHGYDWRESLEPSDKKRSNFVYRFTVGREPIEQSYMSAGHNVDRARHDAAMKALRAHGWSLNAHTPHARSWVGTRQASDRGR